MLSNITFGYEGTGLPSGVDADRLDRVHEGLIARGLSEDEASVAMSYMIDDSGVDPFRSDDTGYGLMDGVGFNDNMFIEDDDSVFEDQLDTIAEMSVTGVLDLSSLPEDTNHGYMLGKRYSKGGEMNDMIANSFYPGGDLESENEYSDIMPAAAVSAKAPAVAKGMAATVAAPFMSFSEQYPVTFVGQLGQPDQPVISEPVYGTIDPSVRENLMENMPTLDIVVPQRSSVVTSIPRYAETIVEPSGKDGMISSDVRDQLRQSKPQLKEDVYIQKDLINNEELLHEDVDRLEVGLIEMEHMNSSDLSKIQKKFADEGSYARQLEGLSKDEIRKIQLKLINRGFLSAKKNASGDYIEADGIVGSKTLTAWNKYNIDGKFGDRTKQAYIDNITSKATEPYQFIGPLEKNDYISESETSNTASGKPSSTKRVQWLQDYIDTAGGIYRNVPENYEFKDDKIRILADSYLDKVNYDNWRTAVSKAVINPDTEYYTDERDGESVPIIDFDWNVSNDQIMRALRFFPGLDENSYPNGFMSSTVKGHGYQETWDSGINDVDTQKFPIVLNIADILGGERLRGLAETSLRTPGRGTVGGFQLTTQPEGIYISDGYQFAAPKSTLLITDKQTEAYNKERESIPDRVRAKNTRSHIYFIPWSAYNALWKN